MLYKDTGYEHRGNGTDTEKPPEQRVPTQGLYKALFHNNAQPLFQEQTVAPTSTMGYGSAGPYSPLLSTITAKVQEAVEKKRVLQSPEFFYYGMRVGILKDCITGNKSIGTCSSKQCTCRGVHSAVNLNESL